MLLAETTSTAYQIGQAFGALFAIMLFLMVPAAFIVSLVLLIKTKKKGWLFLLVPSGLLLAGFFAAFSLAFAAGLKKGMESSRQWQSEEKVPEDRLVETSDALMKLKLPGHWQILKDLNEAAHLEVGNPRREEYLIVINDPKASFDGSLAEYAEFIVDRTKNALTDGEVSGPEPITVDGRPALQYEVRGSVDKVNVQYLFTLTESAANFHQLITWTLASRKSKAFPVFQDVLKSVSIKEGRES
jgi:hypothetical protein